VLHNTTDRCMLGVSYGQEAEEQGVHFSAELRNVNWFVKYVVQGDTKKHRLFRKTTFLHEV